MSTLLTVYLVIGGIWFGFSLLFVAIELNSMRRTTWEWDLDEAKKDARLFSRGAVLTPVWPAVVAVMMFLGLRIALKFLWTVWRHADLLPHRSKPEPGPQERGPYR